MNKLNFIANIKIKMHINHFKFINKKKKKNNAALNKFLNLLLINS